MSAELRVRIFQIGCCMSACLIQGIKRFPRLSGRTTDQPKKLTVRLANISKLLPDTLMLMTKRTTYVNSAHSALCQWKFKSQKSLCNITQKWGVTNKNKRFCISVLKLCLKCRKILIVKGVVNLQTFCIQSLCHNLCGLKCAKSRTCPNLSLFTLWSQQSKNMRIIGR